VTEPRSSPPLGGTAAVQNRRRAAVVEMNAVPYHGPQVIITPFEVFDSELHGEPAASRNHHW